MADGREERRQWLLQLKQSRAAAFRSEVFPYFRYVAQSGFGLLVSAALFFLAIQYANGLEEFPPEVPAGLYGAAAIALAAAWSPFRTYLQRADTIFLLPMEAAVLRDYIRPLRIGAMRAGVLRTLAVYAAFVPLYIRAPHTLDASAGRSLWLLGAVLAALGAWNAWGAWQERQAVYALPRLLLRFARYAATLGSAWALLNAPLLPGLAFAAGSIALATLLGRLPKRQELPWENLIREEAAARRRWRRFLGWFVDVPSEEARPVRRRWAAWIGDRLPWSREHAWHYLYAKTFIRSEMCGAWIRWHLAVGAILPAFRHAAADWTAYGIGVFVAGIQMTELRSIRFSLSVQTLPLPGRDAAIRAAAAAARFAGAAGAVLLWLPAAIPQERPVSGTALAMLAAGLVWSVWLVPRRLAKARDEEEE